MFLINYKDENNAGEAWRTRKNERKKEKKIRKTSRSEKVACAMY